MSPAAAVLGAWLLFGGSHLLLSSPPLRDRLSQKLGQSQFIVFYTLIATLTLCVLIATVARFGGSGVPGAQLSTVAAARWSLGAIALIGAMLATAGIVNYPRSPMAILARRWRAAKDTQDEPLPAPAMVEHITRHPFFVGLALLMGAHALLVSTLAGAVYFAGFALLALLGIPMQDRKLRERHRDTYGAYLSSSSVVPFAALRSTPAGTLGQAWQVVARTLHQLAGKIGQASSLRRIRRRLARARSTGAMFGLAISFAVAVLLAALHPLWHLGHGASFAAVVLVGGLYGVAKQLLAGPKM